MDTEDETLRPDELLAQLGWVRALARSLVRDPDVTDDVLQQVCLLALQKAPRGARAGPRFRAWLAAVTRGLVRRSARADHRRLRRERTAALPEALPATADLAARREALRSLVDAVTTLDEPYGSAIIARYFEGDSVAAIAARTGASTDAVRQRLSRARQMLRARLQSVLAEDRSGWLLAALPALPAKHFLDPLGGILVAKQAGTGAITKAVAALLVGACLVFVTQRVLHEAPDAEPAAVGAGRTVADAAADVRTAPAADLPVPLVPAPTPLLAAGDTAPPARAQEPSAPATDGAPAAEVPRESVRLIIVDAAAQPVPGALVETAVKTGETHPGNLALSTILYGTVASTFSDAIGRCTLSLAVDGETILVSKEGVGSSGRRSLKMLEPTRNAEGDVVIALRAPITVRGQVLLADGSPAPRWPVAIRPTGADGYLGVPRAAPPIYTNEDGRFHVVVDHCKRYDISTAREGLLVGKVLNPEPGEAINVTLQLPGDWWIDGRVTDETGSPVEGATVFAMLVPEGTPPGDFPPARNRRDASAPSDAEGKFAVALKDPGEYLVTAFARGRSPVVPTRVAIEGATSRHTLALAFVAPAQISGIVRDRSGGVVAGVSVALQAVPPTFLGSAGFLGPRIIREIFARSGEDGRFLFEALPPDGLFDVRACPSAPGKSVPCNTPWTRVAAGAADLELVADFGDATAGSLRVTIVSATTGLPVDKVRWSVTPEAAASWCVLIREEALADGLLVLPDLDPSARCTLAVAAEGHGAVDVHDLLASPGGTELRVELPAFASLQVQVVDQRGGAVPYAVVVLQREFRIQRVGFFPGQQPLTADTRGLVRFEQIDAGRHKLAVTAGDAAVEEFLDIPGGQLTTRQVVLTVK